MNSLRDGYLVSRVFGIVVLGFGDTCLLAWVVFLLLL